MAAPKRWKRFSDDRVRRLRDHSDEEWPWDAYRGHVYLYGLGGKLWPRLALHVACSRDGSTFYVKCREKKRAGHKWVDVTWIPINLIPDLEESLAHVSSLAMVQQDKAARERAEVEAASARVVAEALTDANKILRECGLDEYHLPIKTTDNNQ